MGTQLAGNRDSLAKAVAYVHERHRVIKAMPHIGYCLITGEIENKRTQPIQAEEKEKEKKKDRS